MGNFKVLHQDGNARLGKLITPHGVIETPNFNPVGTQATVKALGPRELKEIGVQIILANTYHLMLRPGADLIEKLGGLHKFMNWDKPIMTDSGGFQVFSLGIALEHGSSKVVSRVKSAELRVQSEDRKPRLNKITEEGVTFQSHLDGSKHLLTPEKSIQIQQQLGVDLIVVFDDHESAKHSKTEMLASLELTEKWGLRSLKEHQEKPHGQLLYGVIHGGTDKDLRIRSAKFTNNHFDAIAVGGIYGDHQTLYQMLGWVIPELDQDKPRHLLGIGEVEDLFSGVEQGMDFFDCVAPTRRARFGSLYVLPKNGGNPQNSFTIGISQSKYTTDKKLIDPGCGCFTCQNFSRSYLRHLFMAGEILYHNLATYHNVYFITNLMKMIRLAVSEGKFIELKNSWLK